MMTPDDLNNKLIHVINEAKGQCQSGAKGSQPWTAAQIATVFTSFATALGSDTTTHDVTIQWPGATLTPYQPPPH